MPRPDTGNVRYGSGTDIRRPDFYVRFTPNNGHQMPVCLLWGKPVVIDHVR